MTVSYKLYPNDENGVAKQAIQKTEEGVIFSIPFDKVNTDYQEYLKWVEKGNTAEAAD